MTHQASSFHLQLEQTPQAVPSQDAGSLKRTWFLQGMGLGTLMLIGVYSVGGFGFQHESPSGAAKFSTAYVGAWNVAKPGIRNGGLSEEQLMIPAQTTGRSAASVPRMAMREGWDGQTYGDYMAQRRGPKYLRSSRGNWLDNTGGMIQGTRDSAPMAAAPAWTPRAAAAPAAAASHGLYAPPVRAPSAPARSEAEAKAAWLAGLAQAAPPVGQGAWLGPGGTTGWGQGRHAAAPAAAAPTVAATPVAAPPSASTISEAEAKAAWMAKQDAPGGAPTAAAPIAASGPVVAPAAAQSEAEAKAAWMAKQDAPWGAPRAAAPSPPVAAAPIAAPAPVPVHQGEGKGFGGGEATRDPPPTYIDPNDPKGKINAIHNADSFADYLAKRNAAR